MTQFTVRQGRRYRATVRLSFFQSVASNERVAEEFRKVGFSDVVATGSGRNRLVEGSWLKEDKSGDIPDQVDKIREIGLVET